MSDETEKRLNNIMQFVEAAIIVGGYGYDYKRAIRMLYNGYDLYEVLDWYNSQIESALGNINTTIDKVFKSEV